MGGKATCSPERGRSADEQVPDRSEPFDVEEHLDAEVPFVEIWRSVRVGGDVKTAKSHRTLAIAGYVVQVLEEHPLRQAVKAARSDWRENGLAAFLPRPGPNRMRTISFESSAMHRSRSPGSRIPSEVRTSCWHSFVSILSEHGLQIEEISRLMGDSGAAVTELVHRHELRPVLESGRP